MDNSMFTFMLRVHTKNLETVDDLIADILEEDEQNRKPKLSTVDDLLADIFKED